MGSGSWLMQGAKNSIYLVFGLLFLEQNAISLFSNHTSRKSYLLLLTPISLSLSLSALTHTHTLSLSLSLSLTHSGISDKILPFLVVVATPKFRWSIKHISLVVAVVVVVASCAFLALAPEYCVVNCNDVANVVSYRFYYWFLTMLLLVFTNVVIAFAVVILVGY